MSKATEQNDKLKRAIIISAVLHVILFAALIWSSFDEHIDASAGGGGGSSIDAVMVDPAPLCNSTTGNSNSRQVLNVQKSSVKNRRSSKLRNFARSRR